ncbi:MAG: DNA primase [Chloroflexi bacterium]|nr:DNA primase [Chloroflexota bacterium]
MSVIDEVRGKLDIVDVVQSYVPLARAGRSFKANCPFHAEKTPSFFVFPERQTWHCFGACATGGDVFSFVMKRENIGFGEALRLLANRANVALPERSPDVSGREERLRQACEAAARFYHRMLLHAPDAEVARQHLAGRGLSAETIAAFQLGYSPDSWSALQEHLTKEGFSPTDMLFAGLVVQKDDGGLHDRFRGRLVIPVWDERGRMAGFGARALDDAQQPKYLNSPQTPIYDKSAILYGIHKAREAIRKEARAVIVEGYMDALMAHQHGFANVVASMGTALTERQVDILKRLTHRFVLALDPDVAGDEATLRSLQSAWHVFDRRMLAAGTGKAGPAFEQAPDPELAIASLPRGQDPDEIIRASPDAWRKIVEEATPLLDYLFQVAAQKLDLSSASGKARAVERLYPFIARMDNVFRQQQYLEKLARLLGVDMGALKASIGQLRLKQPGKKGAGAFAPPVEKANHDPLEEYILSVLAQHPEMRAHVGGIAPEHFERPENRELFSSLQKSATIEDIRQALDEHLQGHLDFLLSAALPPSDGPELERALADCLRRVQERHLRRLKHLEEQAFAQGDLSDDERAALEQQGIQRNRELRAALTERKQSPWQK